MSENLGDAVRQALSGAAGDRVRQAAAMSGAPYVPHPPHGPDRECPEAVRGHVSSYLICYMARDGSLVLHELALSASMADAMKRAKDAKEDAMRWEEWASERWFVLHGYEIGDA